MITSTNTLPMAAYIQMVNSKEYEEATLKSFNHGEKIGVRMFKKKIENRIEYYENSIKNKERTLKEIGNDLASCQIDIIENEIEIYKAKIEELQFIYFMK
jgi:hypothetical protein